MVPMPESVSISSRSAWGTVPLMIWAALLQQLLKLLLLKLHRHLPLLPLLKLLHRLRLQNLLLLALQPFLLLCLVKFSK